MAWEMNFTTFYKPKALCRLVYDWALILVALSVCFFGTIKAENNKC